ncbi:MAG: GIY-YIG nuclease family protein [Synergistaceae bacterium]|jgi:predicted GIY-YIG superfamily endonuclease|nr:GIY-YIG nuclease family protein [Synergistaceae bacterium]
MKNLTWDDIQKQSDTILSCGLYKLKTQPFCDLADVTEKGSGNYLISLDEVPFYIGEGEDLIKRLKQQFRPTTSTFYKNFKKHDSSNHSLVKPSIVKFKIQFISTIIGRKELEEFGIVNLPTKLNHFQLGKRNKCVIADQSELWDMVQQDASKLIKEGENSIIKSKFTHWFDTMIINSAGLYLVKDKSDNLIYIGESSDVGKRIITHSGKTYFSALRRHIGTVIYSFQLQELKGKKRYFSETEDKKITEFLKTCTATVYPISFGRYELEEYLIRTYRPLLNIKCNKICT